MEVHRIQDKFHALHASYKEISGVVGSREKFLGALKGFLELASSIQTTILELNKEYKGTKASTVPIYSVLAKHGVLMPN